MEHSDAWEKFYSTGTIKDYLGYVLSLRLEAEEFEQNRERDCNSGNRISRE